MPSGLDIFGFLNGLKQDHIIFIDEFEKLFPLEDKDNNELISQNSFLSFLDDGSRMQKRLFVITANESVSSYLLNRPSRIRYHQEYERISPLVIREIVDDLLVNDEHRADLVESIPQKDVNIDVLIKIIEEVNLHDKPYSTFKDFFNFRTSNRTEFEVLSLDSDEVLEESLELSTPIRKGTNLYVNEDAREWVRVDSILEELSQGSYKVKTYMDNPDYEYDNKDSPRFVYTNVLLRKKYINLTHSHAEYI